MALVDDVQQRAPKLARDLDIDARGRRLDDDRLILWRNINLHGCPSIVPFALRPVSARADPSAPIQAIE